MNTVGAWASVIGVVVSIVGFIATLVNVKRSKNAAQQAKTVADKVRVDMLRANTVGEFASALAEMEEIKTLHRQNLWALLPQHYSALRKALILIRGSNPDLSDEQRTVLQSAIQYLASIERKVDETISGAGQPPNVPKLNAIVSKQIDRLHEVLVEIRNKIGR